MKIKIIIPFLALALAAGCITKASKINAVQIGMSKDQVLNIMGNPSSITADTNSVYLNYALAEGVSWGSGSLAVATPYAIELVNDKVVFYGRVGVPNASSPSTTGETPLVIH